MKNSKYIFNNQLIMRPVNLTLSLIANAFWSLKANNIHVSYTTLTGQNTENNFTRGLCDMQRETSFDTAISVSILVALHFQKNVH